MAERSSIEWCDATFNPWIGCTKVSPACDHCYAERNFDHRLHVVQWGAGQQRKRTGAKNWRLPARWNKNACWFLQCNDCGWRGDSRGSFCKHCHSTDTTPARRRVFCASLADVFDNEVDPQWRADLFRLIEATPNLDWLLLTKRIGNASEMMFRARGGHLPLLPHLWLGATICNQTEADRDIPRLLATPAAVRFVSIEPMMGPIDLQSMRGGTQWIGGHRGCTGMHHGDGSRECPSELHHHHDERCGRGLDWVIVGGESGPKARPMHPEWARSLRDQCAAAGVAFLFKQWGEWGPSSIDDVPSRFSDPALSQFRVISTCGFVCEVNFGAALLHRPQTHPKCFPNAEHSDAICEPCFVRRIGKKAAGRLLDGVEHNGFPGVRS